MYLFLKIITFVIVIAVGKDIWIFSDIRRKTDIHWFRTNYPGKIKTVRILANQDVRIARGWVYTEGKYLTINDNLVCSKLAKYLRRIVKNSFISC